MARKRRSKEETKQVDALIERLREFVRLNYVTAAEIAREIGVNDSTVYAWVLGQYQAGGNPERLAEFLDSLPKEKGSGIARSDTNIVNTRTGAGSQSLAVVRSVSRRKATFGGAVAGF